MTHNLEILGAICLSFSLASDTGFTGALTTFSVFELDADALLGSSRLGLAFLYVGGNLFLGYGALLLGQVVAVRLQ